MKAFHETNYVLFNDKIKNNYKICILSDLHFSDSVSNEKLNSILKKIKEIKPDYIFFCGDLLDSVDDISTKTEEQRLLLWLKELGYIAPLFLSHGSHDLYKHVVFPNKKSENVYAYPNEFFDEIENVGNIYVLNNKSFSDSNLYITGYTQSLNYYQYSNNGDSFRRPKEDKELMIKELYELKKKVKEIPDNKVKFLLVHSPVYLKDEDVIKNVREYDYYVSGHMHNGCVPPLLYELWNSSYGIISPNKDFFQDNERNTLNKRHDKLIVNGPLTMFQKWSGTMQKFNILYPSYITNVLLTNDDFFNTEKVYKKTKYSKW